MLSHRSIPDQTKKVNTPGLVAGHFESQGLPLGTGHREIQTQRHFFVCRYGRQEAYLSSQYHRASQKPAMGGLPSLPLKCGHPCSRALGLYGADPHLTCDL